MTARADRKNLFSRIPNRLRWVFLIPLCIVLAVVGILVYDYMTVNLWMERDAGSLETYVVPLIENQLETDDSRNTKLGEIDRLLIEEMRRNRRNVVRASRSEIRYNLLHTRGYVKLYLETALPDQPDRRSRLRLIGTLKREGGRWRIAGPLIEKTIE